MYIREKKILSYIGIFIITIVSLWLLLIGAAMLSNNQIRDNMEKSALSYAREDAFAFCDGRKWNGVADNYADSIWLNIAWYMGEGNPIQATLNTQYYDGDEMGENAGLYLAVTDENVKANTEYTRYWHGTAGVMRLLHLFFDVKEIKMLGMCVAFLLAATVVFILIKNEKGLLATGFVLALCGVEIWKIGLSIEFQPAFIICFLMCIFFLLAEKRGDHWLIGLSVFAGTLTAFFDFLTTETTVLLVPLILVVVVRCQEGRLAELKKSGKWLAGCGIAWLSAYGTAFLVKWALATIVTGKNQFLPALASVEERVSGTVEAAIPGGAIGQSLYAVVSNLSVAFGAEERVDWTLTIVGTIIIIGLIVSIRYLFAKKEGNRTGTILLSVLGSAVFLRYVVLANQSYLHSFFTYRALVTTILAAYGILIVNCQFPTGHKLTGKKKRSRKK